MQPCPRRSGRMLSVLSGVPSSPTARGSVPNVFRACLTLFVSVLCLLAGGAVACDVSGGRDARTSPIRR